MLRQTLQGIRAVSSVAVPPLSCWLRRTRATSGQPAGTPPRSLITRAASLPPPRPSGQTTVAGQTSTQALAQALAVGRLMSALGHSLPGQTKQHAQPCPLFADRYRNAEPLKPTRRAKRESRLPEPKPKSNSSLLTIR